jgi:hypothetical protein
VDSVVLVQGPVVQSFEVDNEIVDFKNIVNFLTNSVAFFKKKILHC